MADRDVTFAVVEDLIEHIRSTRPRFGLYVNPVGVGHVAVMLRDRRVDRDVLIVPDSDIPQGQAYWRLLDPPPATVSAAPPRDSRGFSDPSGLDQPP